MNDVFYYRNYSIFIDLSILSFKASRKVVYELCTLSGENFKQGTSFVRMRGVLCLGEGRLLPDIGNGFIILE